MISLKESPEIPEKGSIFDPPVLSPLKISYPSETTQRQIPKQDIQITTDYEASQQFGKQLLSQLKNKVSKKLRDGQYVTVDPGKTVDFIPEDVFAKIYGKDWQNVKSSILEANPQLKEILRRKVTVDPNEIVNWGKTGARTIFGTQYGSYNPVTDQMIVNPEESGRLFPQILPHELRHFLTNRAWNMKGSGHDKLPDAVINAGFPLLAGERFGGSPPTKTELYSYTMEFVDLANYDRQKRGLPKIYPQTSKDPTTVTNDLLRELDNSLITQLNELPSQLTSDNPNWKNAKLRQDDLLNKKARLNVIFKAYKEMIKEKPNRETMNELFKTQGYLPVRIDNERYVLNPTNGNLS